ncbi:hypothetical protein [Komagataeibacter kakiaceti]|uniref:hypothetical protein n=1 Tax=Komagataeibacter kakiaceti TaxID=943261 RepID=UPI000AAA6435|nr:hypothetical protein [Komagataeibacter kakiaceti]
METWRFTVLRGGRYIVNGWAALHGRHCCVGCLLSPCLPDDDKSGVVTIMNDQAMTDQLRKALAQAAGDAAQAKVMPVVRMIAAQQLVVMDLMQMLVDAGVVEADVIAARMRHHIEHTDTKDMAARTLFEQVRSRFASAPKTS